MTGDHPKRPALQRTARRVVLLFLLGLIYNGLLQFRLRRICGSPGSCSGSPSVTGSPSLIFLFTKVRTQVILFLAILVGYWADPDVRAVARVEDRRRPRDADEPGRLSRPALSPRQDL